MTATPITNEPFELIKLVNLCKEQNEQLPTTRDEFYKEFDVGSTGKFSNKGSLKYFNAITGNISYLSRENDARQFAKPIITEVKVPLSTSEFSKSGLDKIKEDNLQKIQNEKDILDQKQEDLKAYKKDIADLKKSMIANCVGADKRNCLARVQNEIHQLDNKIAEKKNSIKKHEDIIKIMNKNLKAEYRKAVNLAKEDSSQQGILENKCFRKK
jgi:hypothetical protein